jgi:hypothetical protein
MRTRDVIVELAGAYLHRYLSLQAFDVPPLCN